MILGGGDTVDQEYSPTSENAQSGVAVSQAISGSNKLKQISSWGTFASGSSNLATTQVSLNEPLQRGKLYLIYTVYDADTYRSAAPMFTPVRFDDLNTVNGLYSPVFDRTTATFKCSIVVSSANNSSATFTLFTPSTLTTPVAFGIFAVN